jgi:hypothetical protein
VVVKVDSSVCDILFRISLVNSAVVEYFMEELELQQQFEVFRKFLFMEDGEFSLSLSDQMFEKVWMALSIQYCSCL